MQCLNYCNALMRCYHALRRCPIAHFVCMEPQRRYFLAELALQLRHSTSAFCAQRACRAHNCANQFTAHIYLRRNAFAFLLRKINMRSKLIAQLHALHVPQRCAVGECVCQLC